MEERAFVYKWGIKGRVLTEEEWEVFCSSGSKIMEGDLATIDASPDILASMGLIQDEIRNGMPV